MNGVPINYADLPSLSVPSQLLGEDLKSFGRGARSVIRTVPSSSGSVGASSSMLFNLPQDSLGFIKPNSMSLSFKCTVTMTGATNACWAFAGSNKAVVYDDVNHGGGGASSLISRVNISIGGQTLSYAQYQHYRNAILPHVLSKEYFENDLRQLEYAGVVKNCSSNVEDNKVVFVTLPLWLPLFNSKSAFPQLLVNSPITIEIVTTSVVEAFTSVVASIANFTIDNASLTYESIVVPYSYKEALLASKSGKSYNMHINDWMAVGGQNMSASSRYNIGAGLSSLKSILFTAQLVADQGITGVKKYCSNGLLSCAFYVNNQQVSPPSLTDDSQIYDEMQRALGVTYDSNATSNMLSVINPVGKGLRNSYTTHNFLAGCSTQIFNDWGFQNTGIPADQVSLEVVCGTPTDTQFQEATAVGNASLYVFLLHDSTLSIDVSTGQCMLRK
jgi:hypothetical protein